MDLCNSSNGTKIQRNVSYLLEWASKAGITIENQAMDQIMTCSNLLTAKLLEENVQALCEKSVRLHDGQIMRILTHRCTTENYEKRFCMKIKDDLREKVKSSNISVAATSMLMDRSAKYGTIFFPFNPIEVNFEAAEKMFNVEVFETTN
jgi:hypothetical protein